MLVDYKKFYEKILHSFNMKINKLTFVNDFSWNHKCRIFIECPTQDKTAHLNQMSVNRYKKVTYDIGLVCRGNLPYLAPGPRPSTCLWADIWLGLPPPHTPATTGSTANHGSLNKQQRTQKLDRYSTLSSWSQLFLPLSTLTCNCGINHKFELSTPRHTMSRND